MDFNWKANHIKVHNMVVLTAATITVVMETSEVKITCIKINSNLELFLDRKGSRVSRGQY